MTHWLTTLAWPSLAVAVVCALIVIVDVARGNRQHMWIMNVAWPLTMLYSGVFGLWAYFKAGRQTTHANMERAKRQGQKMPAERRPFWQTAGLGATHCGAGCTLADIIVESVLVAAPFILFGHAIFGSWVIDYIAAFCFGIVFQYFTIKPMRDLSPMQGLIAAIKADAASLTAWQLGMYAWMGIATFAIFGHEIPKSSPVFWFMMQIAMLAGLLTSLPINAWLIRSGRKERM